MYSSRHRFKLALQFAQRRLAGNVVSTVPVQQKDASCADGDERTADAADHFDIRKQVEAHAAEPAVVRGVSEPLDGQHHDPVADASASTRSSYAGDDQRVRDQRQVMAVLFQRPERHDEDSIPEGRQFGPAAIFEPHSFTLLESARRYGAGMPGRCRVVAAS